MRFGDRNTKFFHTRAIISRKRIRIETLKDLNGNWITEGERLKDMAVNHFQNLYGNLESVDYLRTTSSFPIMSQEVIVELSREVTLEEVRLAVNSMGAFKAPRPDGFQASFYQQNWPVVSSTVVNFVKSILDNGRSIENANATFLVLIPKVEHPETILQFRPISLCNVSYKLITKVITLRLRDFMGNMVSPN